MAYVDPPPLQWSDIRVGIGMFLIGAILDVNRWHLIAHIFLVYGFYWLGHGLGSATSVAYFTYLKRKA